MNVPDVKATVASLRLMLQQLQAAQDGNAVIDTSSNASVIYTAGAAIDTLEQQGNRFAAGDYSPFTDATTAWAAWTDVANSTGQSLAASLKLNQTWSVTYLAGQVAQQAASNLKGIGLGVGALVLGLIVLVVVVKL